jgi:putative endonuclease
MAIGEIEHWFVYLLRCADATFYTGITTDLIRRSGLHNAGKASRYTRSRLPVTVIYSEWHPNRSSALRRERFIKSLTRKQKEAIIRKVK